MISLGGVVSSVANGGVQVAVAVKNPGSATAKISLVSQDARVGGVVSVRSVLKGHFVMHLNLKRTSPMNAG